MIDSARRSLLLVALAFVVASCGGGGGGSSVPGKPVGVVAAAGISQAMISWSAVPGAISYNLYMAEVTGVTPANYASLTGGMAHLGVSSPFIHTSLVNGTAYYFVVTAVNAKGEGAASAEVSATPAAFTGSTSAVAAGGSHTLALKSGIVWAWGKNSSGELGNGSGQNTNVPFQVPGLTGVIAIAGGAEHSLALKGDGTVWAWGRNKSGQLGNGLFTKSQVPVPVSGLTSVTAIAAGGNHSLALKSDGTVWAWGKNKSGQLGNGTTTKSAVPVKVSGLSGATAVAAGSSHSVALVTGGVLEAWGANDLGQVGDTTNFDRLVPVAVSVPGGSTFTAVSSRGDHSLALRTDNTVWTWGNNSSGQLGNNSLVNQTSLVQAGGLAGVTAIAGGGDHSLAVSGGNVSGWGDNGTGQIGDGTVVNSQVPVSITTPAGLTSIVAVSGGGSHSVALKSDGTIWTWGNNSEGQLGKGSFGYTTAAAGISGLTNVTALAARGPFALCRINDGSLRSWGRNSSGQLGDGTFTYRNSPVSVINLGGTVTAVSAGGAHGLALRTGGTIVRTWGNNSSGELGDGSTAGSNTPVSVISLGGTVTAVSGGGSVGMALLDTGAVQVWGDNTFGQLGNNSGAAMSSIPVTVSSGTGLVVATALSGGGSHCLALKNDGTVWAWGDNSSGQLGNNSTTLSKVPVKASGLTGVIALQARSDHSLALKSDGTVWAWGDNSDGQLGNGTTLDKHVPTRVSGLSGVVAIAAGSLHGLALKGDGTLWAWGDNSSGQLGDGTDKQSLLPKQVSVTLPIGVTITGVAAGGSSSFLLLSDNTVMSWGDNTFGQLGNGAFGFDGTPSTVP